jgi:hypothetical protein
MRSSRRGMSARERRKTEIAHSQRRGKSAKRRRESAKWRRGSVKRSGDSGESRLP